MIFIVRGRDAPPDLPGVAVKLARPTPARVPGLVGGIDHFCVAEAAAVAALRGAGWDVVALRDGYYEDASGGGVAVWGQGRYWEIRSDPFTVIEAAGPSGTSPAAAPQTEHVEVRRAIFGA